jgi:glycosyltransferase involved in cell wall biosynthesis
MKLCFLAAGDSFHSYRWIRFFADLGHEIHWISLTPGKYPDDERIHFYCLGGGQGSFIDLLRAALRIRALVRSIVPDILHAHYAGSYGLLGLISGWRPYVLTAWGSDILFAGREFIKSALIRRVLARADLITCDALHMIEAMVRLGAERSKIKLVYFGVEADRFSPGDVDPEIIARWAAAGREVVISLRNLEPVYDIGTLLQAVPRLLGTHPELLVVVAGGGSKEDALKAQAEELGVANHVRFVGRYANLDLPAMLRSAKVYVSTSLSDAGIAASTAEAMACGLPVVVTNTGENDRWIDDGDSGYLVPPQAPEVLALRIEALLCDRELREKIGTRARQVIEVRDNYRREMDKMAWYYTQLKTGIPVADGPNEGGVQQ